MRVKLAYVTPLLAAAAAAIAILAAPTAAAAPKTCVGNGVGTTCKSDGNVEITNSAPAVSFYPYGTMPYLLGGR